MNRNTNVERTIKTLIRHIFLSLLAVSFCLPLFAETKFKFSTRNDCILALKGRLAKPKNETKHPVKWAKDVAQKVLLEYALVPLALRHFLKTRLEAQRLIRAEIDMQKTKSEELIRNLLHAKTYKLRDDLGHWIDRFQDSLHINE